jgi:hypothetical protein
LSRLFPAVQEVVGVFNGGLTSVCSISYLESYIYSFAPEAKSIVNTVLEFLFLKKE